MAGQKNNTKIENELNEKLSGDALKNALDFITFMKENEIQPDFADNWFKHQSENICLIITGVCESHNMNNNGDNWSIYWANCEAYWNENDVPDKELENFVFGWENPCGKCPCEHSPGFRKVIFGKVYENSCYSTFCFDNPDSKALGYIKTLVKMRKQNIIDEQRSK
ncbi:MAG: hypothetical protein FWF15_08045 [Oscillospiraceae bacterium]|nr:hypothetical protein [Oscillospiraceae bacterium]